MNRLIQKTLFKQFVDEQHEGVYKEYLIIRYQK